jgi:Disulfide bond formation protein DsbB
VLVLTAVPVGGAVLLALLNGDSPCILCWAQRTSMMLIALVGLFIVRYGPRPRYIGMAVLLGAWGGFMGLRHSALHLARDIGQGFSAPFFGVHTYVWAGFIHWVVLAVVAVLLLLLPDDAAQTWPREPTRASRFAMGLFLVVVGANALQAFATTGPPPFIGQGDPIRFSLNPKHWVWADEELAGRMSFRGAWAVPQPGALAVDPDPAHGPLGNLPSFPVLARERIAVLLNGALTGLARDSSTGRYLAVTDRYDVYLLDSARAQVLHHVRLDPGFSIDLSPLAGATFVGGDTLAVLSTNKSYALLQPNPDAQERLEWRHFLATDGAVGEVGLGRFQTVRAHQMFVLSFAFDPAARELITVSVPNPRHKALVVSRFARGDFVLSSEFEPAFGPGLVTAAPNRSPADYVITGAVVADDALYAISAAYSTLLVIDLRSHTIRAAYAVPGLENPTGLAVRGDELLVAERDGRIAVVQRPTP